jgi:ribosomal protein S18 acetylase RimI-like enzyme
MTRRESLDVVIRRALDSDLEQVDIVFADELAFHVNLRPEIFQMADPVVPRDWYRKILGDPDRVLFVAELGDKLIGLVLLLVENAPDDPIHRPRRYVYVDELSVLEAYRGLGVGRRLMARAQEWALAQGVDEMVLEVWEANTRAIGFYEALGYQTFRRSMRLNPQNTVE